MLLHSLHTTSLPATNLREAGRLARQAFLSDTIARDQRLLLLETRLRRVHEIFRRAASDFGMSFAWAFHTYQQPDLGPCLEMRLCELERSHQPAYTITLRAGDMVSHVTLSALRHDHAEPIVFAWSPLVAFDENYLATLRDLFHEKVILWKPQAGNRRGETVEDAAHARTSPATQLRKSRLFWQPYRKAFA